MGTVHTVTSPGQATLGEAVSAYLATLGHTETRGTRRVYAIPLRALVARFGEGSLVAGLDPGAVAEWFTGQWGGVSASRWNTCLSALYAAGGYWAEQGWCAPDPAAPLGSGHVRALFTARLRRRKITPDRDRALSRERVEELLAHPGASLRDRTLWRMLYESAARSAEVLALDVGDLDLPNRCARVRRKGGAMDLIVWQTGAARLLSRLLRGRTSGPVFLTERKARVELPPGDTDPASGKARLSYDQARDIFKAASGGATLHQLRHSALTHAAGDGTSTPMLMARSGHTSVRSLAKYARVSAEALRRHQAETDPARRR